MKVLYTAQALATGDGRDGHVRSSDGIVDMDVAIPPELGGKGGATNPEQLFAAGYSACFHSALRRVARSRNASVEGSTVGARVGLGMAEAGAFGITVELDIHLPDLDEATARELTEAAHKVCPYSNATRGNVEVTLSVV
jgi:osmotically inducible protein OsmC